MKWQPIETAPKDGTWFVIAIDYHGDFKFEIGRYQPLMWDKFVEADNGLFRKTTERIYEWDGFNNFSAATHWMPLPPPPK